MLFWHNLPSHVVRRCSSTMDTMEPSILLEPRKLLSIMLSTIDGFWGYRNDQSSLRDGGQQLWMAKGTFETSGVSYSLLVLLLILCYVHIKGTHTNTRTHAHLRTYVQRVTEWIRLSQKWLKERKEERNSKLVLRGRARMMSVQGKMRRDN